MLVHASTRFRRYCQANPPLLSKPSKNQGDAAGEKPPTQNGDSKCKECARAPARMAFVKKIVESPLHHQYGQSCQCSHTEPPDERPHTQSSSRPYKPLHHFGTTPHANLADPPGPVKHSGRSIQSMKKQPATGNLWT